MAVGLKIYMWCGTKPTSYLSRSSHKSVTCGVEEIHLRTSVLLNYISAISFSILLIGHRMQKYNIIDLICK
jgi:hypothetical protein